MIEHTLWTRKLGIAIRKKVAQIHKTGSGRFFETRMAFTYIDQVHIFPFFGALFSSIFLSLSPQTPVYFSFYSFLDPLFMPLLLLSTLILIHPSGF